MRLNCLLILLTLSVFPLTGKAADQPALREELKPLEWILGNWESKFTDDNGQAAKWILEVKAEIGGTVVNGRWSLLDKENRAILSGSGTYYWQGDSKNLAAVNFDNTGGHGCDLLVKQTDQNAIWQGYRYDSKGSFGTSLTKFVKVDENHFTVEYLHQIQAGETMPDGKISFTRIMSSPEQEIIKLENAWNDATVKKDIEKLEKFLADDFTEVDPGGNLNNKQVNLENIKSGKLALTSAVMDLASVKIFGDTAVITARNTIKGTDSGNGVSGQYRFTDTWIKREGQWQCVASQATKIVK